MGKKGQVMLYSLMVGIVIIVFGIAIAPAFVDFTTPYRNNTASDEVVGLDCTNTSISDYDKGACVVTDFNQAYFILAVIGIGLFIIVVGVKKK